MTVVVPAHNEFAALSRCLGAIRTAAIAVALPTSVVVVLDACDDGSAGMIGQFGQDVHFIAVDERNVGAARAAGFRYAKSVLAASARDTGTQRRTPTPRWAAIGWCANSAVAADMVLGLVRVGQWRHHSEQAAELYEARYHAEAPLHQHIHGANMGFRSEAYWRVGGFAALASGEDVDLVDRFRAAGSISPGTISCGSPPRTGGGARAPDGFADHLAEVSQEVERHGDRADEVS